MVRFLEKTRNQLVGMNDCIDDIKISLDLKHEIMQLKADVLQALEDMKQKKN